MARRIVVIGAGGHAKVVVDLLRARADYEIVGCLGAGSDSVAGVPVLGGDDLLPSLRRDGVTCVALGIGDNAVRTRLGREAVSKGFEAPALIHPRAVVASSVQIGRGSVVMAGAVVNPDASIGDFCIVNTLACIEHDCALGEGAHVAPRAALAGGVQLGEHAFMGVGSCAIPGRKVGARAVVGAGAAVVADIADDVVATGVPARFTRRR
jgi:UDP-perosamine 4-acetyltransferase